MVRGGVVRPVKGEREDDFSKNASRRPPLARGEKKKWKLLGSWVLRPRHRDPGGFRGI